MMVRGWLSVPILLLVMALAACQKADETPTPTPDQESVMIASTLFAQPTHAIPVTPTMTPSSAVELALNRTIARMEQAVLAGDVETYLTYIWSGDPLFVTEQAHWAQDWHDHPLSVFTMELFSIQELDDDTVSARMATRWTRRGATGDGSSGGATTSVIFRREDDRWLLAGERWQTVEGEGFTLYYFKDAIVNNQLQADAVLQSLPLVVTTITRLLDYVPREIAYFKMYDSYATLQNWTRLSMPVLMTWYAPGESIRMAVNPVNNTAPTDDDLAREYTRFVLSDMGLDADTVPWWLPEGIATYSSLQFRTLNTRQQIISRVAGWVSAPADADMRLWAWSALETLPAVPETDRQNASQQAYTLVQFVTDTYGDAARNTWIKALAAGQLLDNACMAAFDVHFADLDAAWRAWLLTQSGAEQD